MTLIFRNEKFLRWAVGLGFDRLGNAVYSVVLPLLIYHMSSSVEKMAVITFFQFLPRLFPGIYVGSIVDVFSKKIIFISALVFQAAVSMLIALFYFYGLLNFKVLCFLVFF